LTPLLPVCIFAALFKHLAQVAELVDALASGASYRKVVEVQVLFWAPFFINWTAEEVEVQIMCHLRAWKEGRANLVTDTVKQLIGVRPDVRRAMDRGESGGFYWLRYNIPFNSEINLPLLFAD
jgi:hypothetical protein